MDGASGRNGGRREKCTQDFGERRHSCDDLAVYIEG